ncbi:YciI family protein [Streptodolium elevatio]|uniref:YciI family protein n=1 Tax=Streptodolium elevatio TaxID=3157996 RepID=A0ABV3D8Q0_9ACTN
MQFLLVAYDGTDEQALERRMRVRDDHVRLGDAMVAAGSMLFGTAILDGADRMIGSMLVLDFPSRDELDAWLKVEPYVTGGVWERIDVQPCRVGPSFAAVRP